MYYLMKQELHPYMNLSCRITFKSVYEYGAKIFGCIKFMKFRDGAYRNKNIHRGINNKSIPISGRGTKRHD